MEGMMKSTCLAGVVVAAGLLGSAVLAQTPTVYKPGDGVVSPKVIHDVHASYTPEAMRAGVAGVVKMQAIVLTNGTVGEVRVTQPLDPGLDDQAVKALKQWTFSPGTKDGKPVPVSVEVEMSFYTDRNPRVDSPQAVKPGNGVTSPRLRKEVKPSYPAEARAAAITGTIEMECVVLANGQIGDVKVTKALDPALDAEAIRTVRQWTFDPGTKDGQPVPVQVTIELSGQFNGKPISREQKFQIGTEWTAVSMDFTPPEVLAVRFGANFTVPEGATVLADSASFRPMQQARR
jgi:TonB family protein